MMISRHSAVLCGAGVDSVPITGARKGNTKVTIYNGTDCKLYDAGCEGELLGRRRLSLRGQPRFAAKGI
jgi:hypothetical protein